MILNKRNLLYFEEYMFGEELLPFITASLKWNPPGVLNMPGFFIPLPKTNIMAEEKKYDYDSINELLTWAKETLNNKRYPAGEFQLDKCAKILDCGKYLDSMIAVISRNWENPTFYPTVDQLRTFREKIEKAAE